MEPVTETARGFMPDGYPLGLVVGLVRCRDPARIGTFVPEAPTGSDSSRGPDRGLGHAAGRFVVPDLLHAAPPVR